MWSLQFDWSELKCLLASVSSGNYSDYSSPVVFPCLALWSCTTCTCSFIFNKRLKGIPSSFLGLFLCIAPSSLVFFPINFSCLASINSNLYLFNSARLLCSAWGSATWANGLDSPSSQKTEAITGLLYFQYVKNHNSVLFVAQYLTTVVSYMRRDPPKTWIYL